MSGVLQGLAVNGRIPISIISETPTLFGNVRALLPPAYYFRGMGFNEDNELLVYTDIIPQEHVNYAGHIPCNDLGMVLGVEDAPQGYSQGATPINIGGSNVWPALVRCVMPLKDDLSFLVDQGGGPATFTRALPEASYIDKDDGIMKFAGADTPRFETDGFLTEGPSTNVTLSSQVFNDLAYWTPSSAQIADNNTIAPDGTMTAAIYQMISGGYLEQIPDVVFTTGTWVTASVYFKSFGSPVCSLRMDTELGLDAGRIEFVFATETFSVNTGVDASFEKLTNGWYRISFSYEMVTDDKIRYRIMNTEGVLVNPLNYFWGAQLENLEVATSYIPTTTLAVTRAQDVLTIPPSNMTPPENDYSIGITSNLLAVDALAASEFTWDVEVTTGQRRGVVRINQGARVIGDGATLDAPAGLTNKGENNRVTSTYDVEGSIYVNTVLGDSDVITTPDTGVAITFTLGKRTGSTSPMYGHLTNLRVYDAALTQEQIDIEATFLNIMPRLCYDLTNPVTHYAQGVPYTASGAIAVSGTVAPPTSSFSSDFSGDFS